LVVVHLVALVVELGIVEGVLETTLLALADKEEDEQGKQDGSGSGGSNIDAGFGTRRQIVPFFRQRLWRGLADLLRGGRVTPARSVAVLR
jgi:hypothetical protein